MSAPSELIDYTYQAPIMPLAWIPHGPNSTSSAYRLLNPQMSAYSSAKFHCNSSPITSDASNTAGGQSSKRRNNRKVSKPSYKHVPHKDKPPHLVARRNARERKRVQAVNSAFAKLRKCVPIENRNKRLSKVKTLHRAIEYINGLTALLRQSDDTSLPNNPIHYSRHRSESHTSREDDEMDDEHIQEFNEFEEYLESDIEIVNKENESRGWTSLSTGCEPTYWSCVPFHEECTGNIPS